MFLREYIYIYVYIEWRKDKNSKMCLTLLVKQVANGGFESVAFDAHVGGEYSQL